MRLLELFSGTGSVGAVAAAEGWEVISVDCDKKANATHCADILRWECPYPPGYFDWIHASPPCTEYSIAKTCGVRNLELADSIATKTLRLIADLRPACWTLENPWTGMLRKREFMTPLASQMRVVSYCQYGLPYRKATAIWTNLSEWHPKPLCTKANPCEQIVDGKHPMVAQAGPTKCHPNSTFKRSELYRIPEGLAKEWVQAASAQIHRGAS
jgi:hypothetical protein